MQVGLIAQFMEPTPSLTAVVMACVTTQNRLFTSALTRAGLCSATRHVLTSRDPKAKQSKPTALLTGRKEAPITLWLRWTAAMSAWRIRSQASDVLFTRKHTTAFSFRSQLKQSVIYILQMKDTEQWNCQDVRIIDSLYNNFILKQDNTSHVLQHFNQSLLFSKRRWQQLSFPHLVLRTSQIPLPLIFQCLPNQPSWKCPYSRDYGHWCNNQIGMLEYEVRDKYYCIVHSAVC